MIQPPPPPFAPAPSRAPVPAGPDAQSVAREIFGRAAAHLQAGRHSEAERGFAAVVRLLPAHANSWRNLGLLRHARGDTVGGLRCVIRALILDPAIADAPGLPLRRLFADAHAQAQAGGEADTADRIARDWPRRCPHDPTARGAGAMAALSAGDLEQAAVLLRGAPDAPDPTLCHARALLALARGRPAEAATAARVAIRSAPAYADAWATLGTLALRHRDGEGAAVPLARALHLAPDHAGALLALASLRLSEGRADDAARHALRVPPEIRRAPAHLGDLLSILHHAPGIDPNVILAEREGAWPRSGGWSPDVPAPPDASPLRVVYVGDLTRPQVAALALPALRAHARPEARTRIAAHLVHASPPDQAPAAPPPLDDGPPVHTVPDGTAESLRARIGALAPHVLVLLTPTTLPQALEALAARMAPVQVIWGDVFGSVGLPGLDALLTDAHHVPDPTLLSERAVALPHGAYFFQPPPDAPEPGPPPCLSRGYLTVGSFNRLDKINDPLLARWGRLMAALPGARLVVQARALDRAATRADVTARLARTGVDPDRVTMEGGRDRAGMMDLFRTVDVALDSDPWSGGLTVLELLWMGVPSVSLAGRFPNGRHAVSHLTRVGLADWIADTPDAYIARVVAADRDRPGLAGIRAGLRARLAALPLCDPAAYAAQLEDTYHRLWADHRAGRAPGTG